MSNPTLKELMEDPTAGWTDYSCECIVGMAKDYIEQLQADLSNERARGIHSCGPHCQRLECRQRRKIEELEAALDKYSEDEVLQTVESQRKTIKSLQSVIEQLEEVCERRMIKIEQLQAEVTMLRSTWTPPEDDEPPEDRK